MPTYNALAPASLGHEHDPHIITMEQALADATFGPNRALDPSVRQLELGRLGDEISGIRNTMMAFHGLGQPKLEWGKVFYTTNERTVGASGILIGTENSLLAPLDIDYSGGVTLNGEVVMQQNQYLAAIPHSHPLALPHSTTDLMHLFKKQGRPDAAAASIVIDEYKTSAIFRGPNTPQWSIVELAAKQVEWDRQRLETYQREYIRRSTNRPDMSYAEKMQLEYDVQIGFLQKLMETYDLHLFVGRAGSHVLDKQAGPPPDMQGKLAVAATVTAGTKRQFARLHH